MSRLGFRVATTVVGATLLMVYLLAAVLFSELLVAVLSTQTNLLTTAWVVLVTSVAFAYLSYRYGTAKLLGNLEAVEVPAWRAPELYQRLDSLCDRMGIDRPRVLVSRMREPNAFAVGGGRATLVLDQRLFSLLEADEFEAILAHELAHLESKDALVGTLMYSTLRTLAGLVVVLLLPLLLLATGLAKALGWLRGRPTEWTGTVPGRVQGAIEVGVATLLSAITLLFLAHSRRREYAADDRAIDVTGRPLALARALAKIHRASGSPWGLLSMLRVSGKDDSIQQMLSTHPPIEERIDRIVDRAREGADLRTEPLRIRVE